MSDRTSMLSASQTVEHLRWPDGPVDVVLDTDTYNEIDDQFAVVYALLSSERINLQAIYATPFHNRRSSGPADGMERSYEEIGRVLDRMNRTPEGLAYRGQTAWLTDTAPDALSPATTHLIEAARSRQRAPLYVVAIGAITNIAAALRAAPDIAQHIVVLWLGGHPLHWPHVREFNMSGDTQASRHVLDCGVPLVLFPCAQVAEKLNTTVAEMDAFVNGRGPIGSYLHKIFCDYSPDLHRPGASKVIWDLAPLAWLNNADWFATALTPSPLLTGELTWSRDPSRHLIRVATDINRDAVFHDLFTRLHAFAG